jgi:hypothetical protein
LNANSAMPEMYWDSGVTGGASRYLSMSERSVRCDGCTFRNVLHIVSDIPEWVLKWWKANVFSFPLMAKAAQDYLPIPSAEVGIEREFSIA